MDGSCSPYCLKPGKHLSTDRVSVVVFIWLFNILATFQQVVFIPPQVTTEIARRAFSNGFSPICI